MRKTYYVSVASATIEDNDMLADQANYAYEFVVKANEEELRNLRELLDAYTTDMEKTFARAPAPTSPRIMTRRRRSTMNEC
ncbi:hypothetical protein ACHHV8_09875 [Paenibacillus sp. TAB 01]|uniref:hypothetical protein n=1 Tax=Paenibacillus sp. TAB 01 TaxID=3368988 RepID=UPI0037524D2A